MRTQRQNGVALITALFVLILVTALAVGMCWMVMTDQRLGGNNQFRETAFYGAEAGMEKLTADVGQTFATKGALSPADMLAVTSVAKQPPITGIQFLDAAGNSTYQILCGSPLVSPCVPVSQNATMLPPSPYAGMQGLITPFTLQVVARGTVTGAEVKLQRQVQVVAIPVFQFGIYSDSDLSFFNGPPFNFGGRVHTNGNLWLAANAGPLYLADKVTVVGQVIRTNLENGLAIPAGGYGGTVTIAVTPNPPLLPAGPTFQNAQWWPIGLGEGSVVAPSSFGAVNTGSNPAWAGVWPRYNGQLQNLVPKLSLTSTALSGIGTPISLIRRPIPGELGTNPAEFNQQYFSEASLRILLDDYGPGKVAGSAGACNASDMMALDTVTATPPVDLSILAFNGAPPAGYAGVTFPLPLSQAVSAAGYTQYTSAAAKDGYWIAPNKATITGCIKIEYQNAGGGWVDVTNEILNLGITGRNINPQVAGTANTLLFLPPSGTVAASWAASCGGVDPSPNAVIRIARLRDNPSSAYVGAKLPCNTTTFGYDYWPLVLYDTRESISRDYLTGLPDNPNDPGTDPQITAQGVINYIELDVNNVARWFTGAIGATGGNANNAGGYAVYFSDRRGNLTDPVAGMKVGSFGFNNIVNLGDAANGCPDGVLDQGEDLEGDLPPTLRTYGGTPLVTPLVAPVTVNQAVQNPLPGVFPLVLKQNPFCGAVANPPAPNYVYFHNQEARQNPPVFFRRALKLVNGKTFNLGTACYGAPPNPPCGLTISAENPVYIQGDYNAPVNDGTWGGFSVASSVAADSVTLLSNNWNDINSFISPYAPGSRPGTLTAYRAAIIAGKGIPFPQTAGSAADYGTDGGVHNFLRYLEGWGANLYYEGSLVSFYYNRQGIGLYKCCNTVYGPPSRKYTFDNNFTLGPQWLPPRTPSLRSVNTIGFSQELLPTQ